MTTLLDDGALASTPGVPVPFGRVLRDLRGLTTRAVFVETVRGAHADVHGIVATALTHWESGRRVPSPRQLRAIVLAHGYAPGSIERLVLAAADHPTGYLYRGLVQAWAYTGAVNPGTRTEAFLRWAAEFPTVPPRGGDREPGGPACPVCARPWRRSTPPPWPTAPEGAAPVVTIGIAAPEVAPIGGTDLPPEAG